MRKYIEMTDEVVNRLKDGKYVEGSMHYDAEVGKIVFRAYQRQSRKRYCEEILGHTDFGVVATTKTRYKWRETMPSKLSSAHLCNIMDRECQMAKGIIATHEIIDRV